MGKTMSALPTRVCCSFGWGLLHFITISFFLSSFTTTTTTPRRNSADSLPEQETSSSSFHHHPKVLWGIFTEWKNEQTERRNLVRNTYLSFDSDKFCSLENYKRNATLARTCQVIYVFVIGGGDPNGPAMHWPTQEENATSMITAIPKSTSNDETTDDVVALNIRENMNHGKSPTWFHYGAKLAQEYGFDYVAKCDMDIVLWVPSFLHFLQEFLQTPRPEARVYGGVLLDGHLCGRRQRCRQLERTHLIYMSGQAYIMSPALIRDFRYMPELENGLDEDMAMGKAIMQTAKEDAFGVHIVPLYKQTKPWNHGAKTVEEYSWYWNQFLELHRVGNATLDNLNDLVYPGAPATTK